MVSYIAEADTVEGIQCPICSRRALGQSARRCGICGKNFHVASLEESPEEGPWHCKACSDHAAREGTRDVTLDKDLCRYVISETHPEEVTAAQKKRLERASRFLVWDSDRLWVNTKGIMREVPPIYRREQIIEEAA